jgi:DNA-binding NtrC family response regulator
MQTMEKIALIVDDDTDTRDMLCIALTAEDWLCQTTSDLFGALHVLTEKTSVMLLDYNLPGIPMEDFIEKVKAINPRLKIVLISGIEDVGGKAKALGIALHLGKPFEFARLREVMSAAAEGRK